MSKTQKMGFILFGGFIASVYPALLSAIKVYQLAVLVIDDPDPSYYQFLDICAQDSDHPFWQMDEIAFISPAQHQIIFAQIMTWVYMYDIKGICCVEEEFVEVAGIIADVLHLPYPGLPATRICSDKFLQRKYLQEWSPDYVVVPPKCRQEICTHFSRFPIVLKPAKRHSSSGVQLLYDQKSLLSCLSDYAPEELLLLEEYIIGREFSLETVVQDGRIIFANITQKRTKETMNRYFVPVSHTIPATNVTKEEVEALFLINSAILEKLKFQDGIAHAEYRIAPDGQMYLMEIAARCPGGNIMTLYYLATGKPFESVIIDLALGIPTMYSQPLRYSRQVYLDHQPGYLDDVVVDDPSRITPLWLHQTGILKIPQPGKISDPATLRALIVLKQRGEWLEEITTGTARSATYLIDAAQVEDLDILENSLQQRIVVLTTVA